jgi:hypothetical protein
MKIKRWLLTFTLLCLAFAAPASALAPGCRLQRHTGAASAGGTSTSDSYRLHGSLGQPSVSSSLGGSYIVTGGIWRGAGGRQSRTYLPLVMHNFVSRQEIADAPDACPGLEVQFGVTYVKSFDHENDNDWFQFDAVAGRTYTMQTGELHGDTDTVLYLRDTDCETLIEENDDISYPDNIASRIVWTATASGTYHAQVRNYDYRVYGANTGYTFQLVKGAVTAPAGLIASGGDKPAPPPMPIPE